MSDEQSLEAAELVDYHKSIEAELTKVVY